MFRLPTQVDADTPTAFSMVTIAYWPCTLSIRNWRRLIKTDNSASSGKSADYSLQFSQTATKWDPNLLMTHFPGLL